jgi:integrase
VTVDWRDSCWRYRRAIVPGQLWTVVYLPSFWMKLAEINTVAAKALMFTILTFARTSETLRITSDAVSFPDANLRNPPSNMKMGKPHDVPLSEQAMRILGDQMVGRGKNPYVFPGFWKQGRLAQYFLGSKIQETSNTNLYTTMPSSQHGIASKLIFSNRSFSSFKTVQSKS